MMKRWIKTGTFALAAELALFAAGCAGGNANQPAAKSGASAAKERQGPLPPDEAAIKRGAVASNVKVSSSDRADFEALVQRWEKAKAAGPLQPGECKSLA